MHSIKKIIRTCMLLFAIFTCTGCTGFITDSTTGKNNVAIIVGNTANSASVDITTTLSDYISLSASSNAYIAFIMPDGNPSLQYATTVPEIPSSYSNSKQKSILTQYVSELSTILQAVAPLESEVNLATALQLGARSLSAAAIENSNEYLVVVHSGLSTSGGIDFTQGLLNMNEEEIANFIDYLIANNEIPDLSNIDVVWYGLGDTASPQQSLSALERTTLEAIWQAFFDAAGATVTFKLDVSSTSDTDSSLPYVTPIESGTYDAYNPFEPDVFDETQIAFEANTAVFVDEEAALSSLAPVIAYALEHPDYSMLLAGTTAKVGDAQSSIDLSLARAQAVKALLIESGVNSNQIFTMGLGYTSSFYIEDWDENGNLIESTASANRAVIIMPYTGQDVSDFDTSDSVA